MQLLDVQNANKTGKKKMSVQISIAKTGSSFRGLDSHDDSPQHSEFSHAALSIVAFPGNSLAQPTAHDRGHIGFPCLDQPRYSALDPGTRSLRHWHQGAKPVRHCVSLAGEFFLVQLDLPSSVERTPGFPSSVERTLSFPSSVERTLSFPSSVEKPPGELAARDELVGPVAEAVDSWAAAAVS